MGQFLSEMPKASGAKGIGPIAVANGNRNTPTLGRGGAANYIINTFPSSAFVRVGLCDLGAGLLALAIQSRGPCLPDLATDSPSASCSAPGGNVRQNNPPRILGGFWGRPPRRIVAFTENAEFATAPESRRHFDIWLSRSRFDLPDDDPQLIPGPQIFRGRRGDRCRPAPLPPKQGKKGAFRPVFGPPGRMNRGSAGRLKINTFFNVVTR